MIGLIAMLVAAATPLTQTAQQTGATAAPQPAVERRICKRTVDTGSLVRGKKECRTKAEWDLIAYAARQNGEDIVQRNAGTPPGGN